MLKRNIFKILAIVFFLLAGATLYNSNKKKQIQPVKLIQPFDSFEKTQDKSAQGKPTQPTKISPTIFFTPTTIPTQAVVQPTNTPAPQPTSVPPTSAPQNLKISLSIAGSSVGTFDIPQGSNQCDVLTQALSQGKIQSLNMRYNADYGTNAVYQINGIGKENAVWWGFKVNGQSPTQGCSFIKVNDGDNVLWEYIGN